MNRKPTYEELERRVKELEKEVAKHEGAEEKLLYLEGLYKKTINSMTAAIHVVDTDLKLVLFNTSFMQWNKELGLKMDIIGKTPFDVFPFLPDKVYDEYQWVFYNKKTLITEEDSTVKGKKIVTEIHKIPGFDGDRVSHVITIIHDITKHKKAEEEIRARNKELSALYALSTHMRKAECSADLLPIVLCEMRCLLRADSGIVTRLSSNRTYFTIAFADGRWEPNIGRTFPVGQGTSSTVLDSGEVYVTENYSTEASALDPCYTAQTGPAVFVPLLSETELIGVLAVSRRLSPDVRSFIPAEVDLLTAIGEMAGNALRRQDLYEDAKRRLAQTQALRKIDMAITGSLDLRVTFNVALDEVTNQLGIDAAAILRLKPYTRTLEYAAGRGFLTRGIEQTHLRLGEGHAGKAAQEQRNLYISDLTAAGSTFTRGQLLVGEHFIVHYVVPLIAKGQVLGVLEIFNRTPFEATQEWLAFLDTLAGQTAIAIDNMSLFQDLERSNISLLQAYDETIKGWAFALDLKEEETEAHSRRVTELTLKLAQAWGMSDDELMHMRRGALLHDIGKMGIPDSVLLKPGKLTDEEWGIMRQHPMHAYKMLAPIDYLRPAVDIPYCHHEKWDGTGYPRGLKGKEIPVAARLFAVVDVWDALTSERPYRKAWSQEKTLEHIRSLTGTHFDPKAVETFLRVMDKQ